MAINRVTLTGNLTRDPEMRATSNGTQIMSFTIAVNDRRRNQQTGVWEEYPNFVGCVMFGRRAEALGRYLAKGRKVAVEGSLRYSTWTSDGAKRSKLEVVIDDLELMSSSRSEGQATRQPSTHGTSSFGKASAEGEPYTDIPFDSADSSESYPYDEPDSNELCDVDY
ncbi:Helix-destabilizing protein [uncultured Collinsella sp.]|nr:Helix-destabilizing protein [uncultured Collinsella sp.]